MLRGPLGLLEKLVAPTKVAILGAGFIADIHLESYTRFVPDAQVTPSSRGRPSAPSAFATHWKIPQVFTDLDTADSPRPTARSSTSACRTSCITSHARRRVHAARHVIIEKPLCMTLEEADEMIAVCREHGGS